MRLFLLAVLVIALSGCQTDIPDTQAPKIMKFECGAPVQKLSSAEAHGCEFNQVRAI